MTDLPTRNLDEIVDKWRKQHSKPASIPGWCWGRPYSNEPYYQFMHWLVQVMHAKLVVELGVDTGTSSVFLATASPEAKIVSVDINSNSIKNLQGLAQQHNLTNLITIHGSTTDAEIVSKIKEYGPIDLLFIDTLHTFEQASAEYNLYTPLMATDGIIAHDDINYSPGMKQYWESVSSPKREVPELHWTNFGLSGGS